MRGGGASFNVLDGHPLGNNFVNNVNRFSNNNNLSLDNTLVLSLNKTSSFSIYGEYQYDIDKWLTVAVRLQYHQNDMQYRLYYSSYGSRSLNYLYCTLRYLEIPFFANWKSFRRPHFSIFASAGTGLSMAFGSTHNHKWPDIIMNSDNTSMLGTVGFAIANNVNPTCMWRLAPGAEYELPQGHKLAATAALTLNQSRYKYETHALNMYSNTLRQHDIRLGVTYFL